MLNLLFPGTVMTMIVQTTIEIDEYVVGTNDESNSSRYNEQRICLYPRNSGHTISSSTSLDEVMRYEFKWFEGEQLPKIVKDVIIDTDYSEVEEENIHYASDTDPEDDIESSTYTME
ncbi:hypothetical protein FQA39_LY16314 [Lamprigera yunnana]|nr:hypothetical protein FQA39_LY16314 [Lamprigera yunnana]